MTHELKPCPFCGGTDLEVLDDRVYCKTDGCETWGPCPSGGLTDAMDKESAIDAWNDRPQDTDA
jgi:hypothetical protein